MHRELVLQENDLTIWKYHGIPENGIAFFESTNWGSAGMVYERKNSNELIRLLKDPYLYAIEQNNTIVGTAVFCHTQPRVNNQPYNCYIIRYFAASAAIQSKKLMKYYAGKVMEVVQQKEIARTIYVGCVEKGNLRSYRVVENAGYENLGLLCVQAFSRFYPKPQPDITPIKQEEQNQMLNLIHDQYRHHALVHTDYLFLKDNYFVIREQDEIVAGCQYHRVHWAINRCRGLWVRSSCRYCRACL